MEIYSKTIFNNSLSDVNELTTGISMDEAVELFNYFKHSRLFKWTDANNHCEDRANAITMLLDRWQVPNFKAWVFSGYVFNKIGFLKNLWRYHVAVAVPVLQNGFCYLYVIDPATKPTVTLINDWAEHITDNPFSYYLVKNSKYYIFQPLRSGLGKWYKWNKRNFKWTIQGLTSINALSGSGKAKLIFNKKKIGNKRKQFMQLLQSRRKPF